MVAPLIHKNKVWGGKRRKNKSLAYPQVLKIQSFLEMTMQQPILYTTIITLSFRNQNNNRAALYVFFISLALS